MVKKWYTFKVMNYLEELNDKQYEAVSAKDKYLRIIAGAGSGKTRVLTYRISYLIDVMHVRPSEILAITFTNKVAKEMKERTLNLLPDFNLDGLTISTFHSWCARFLRSEIQVLGFPRNYIIYDDDDQLRLIKEIGVRLGFKKSDEMNKSALNFISRQKTIGNLPSDVIKGSFKDSKVETILMDYFRLYEQAKNEAYALDFDDLLIYTLKILKDFPEICDKYSRRYHDILIDEFQDTNDLQFKLLTKLVGPYTNLYVVGDPDQTIYTWRGANQKIILDIDKIYTPMRSIVLNENYRSTNEILKVANKLISNNKERVPKDLFTNKTGGKKVSLKCLDNSILEANFVASTIDKIVEDNKAEYKDIAVLYRSSYLSLKIENALTTRRIPYNVYGGLKFYSRKEIKDCLAYFRLLINPKDDVSFDRIINVPKRGFGEKTIGIIKLEAMNNNLSCLEYVEHIDEYSSELKEKTISTLRKLAKQIADTRAKIIDNQEAYSEVLDGFLKDIGYYEYLSSLEDEDSALENVKALIDDIRNYLKAHEDSTFDEYLQNVTLLTSQDDIDSSNKVSLMTVHTAKGLEYDYVFVIGLSEGVFPNQRAINERSNTGLEEERRLAYVAFTRAKKELYLTLNRDYNYTSKCSNIPSQFLKEAGIELPGLNVDSIGLSSNSESRNIYRYDFGKFKTGSGLVIEKEKPRIQTSSNFMDLNTGNNIKWKVGDTAIHKTFGEGKVTNVENDIITVDFYDFGTKKLLGSHKSLSKKGED